MYIDAVHHEHIRVPHSRQPATFLEKHLAVDLALGATMFQLPPLADGVHTLGGVAAREFETVESFGGDSLLFDEIFDDQNRIIFTVPEPSGGALAVAVLVSVLALRSASERKLARRPSALNAG